LSLHGMANANDEFRDGRQLAFFREFIEDRLKAGYEENDEHIEDNKACCRQKDWVGHRADDLGLEILLVLRKVGDAFENVLEKAAFLAGPDHANRKLVEHAGIVGHRFG
jgi:hypothetical protein